MESNLPDKAAIIQQLRQLDGETESVVQVFIPIGHLIIVGSAVEDRVRVTFYSKINSQFVCGTLRDDNPGNRPEKREISIIYNNGEWDDIPIEETVSLDQAVAVVEYFIDHNALPPFAQWDGNIPNTV